jgi:predicted dehydrogenase
MHTPSKLRWGILGAARINQRLLPAIVEADNVELVAIASRRDGAAAATLAQYAPEQQGVKTYDALDDLLNDEDVQAVYIPMANNEHVAWTLRAIAHGKHVLCEKPMALAVTDIDTIAEAARRHNVTVMEGFMYRFHPQLARVLELVQSGRFGEIRSARSSFAFMMRPERIYRLQEDMANGGGALWDIGCYAIHSLRQFFGQPPVSVMAMAKRITSGADVAASGSLDFGEGRFAQFNFSFEHARCSEYELIGTKGGIKCHTVWQLPGDEPVISWWTEDGQQGEEHLSPANHFTLEIEHFSQAVLSGNVPLLTLDDARANCQTLVATLKSITEGRLVSLSEIVKD